MNSNIISGQLRFISESSKKEKKVKDNFRAYLTEGCERTLQEGYPIIPSWMIPKEVDDIKIIPFSEWKNYKNNIEDYYICFFCQDDVFSVVLNNPRKYIKLFRRAKGIIGFDYSIYYDMPAVKQKSQMNDNLSLTFYYGMRNIKVIPNIRYGIESTRDDFLSAIPRNSVIAIGSYGCVKTKKEKERFRYFLREMLPILMPKVVVVYGAMPDDVFGEFKDKYSFVQCEAIPECGKKEVC
ncbi:protein of unknown function [Eubacterium uniforme]|uniref:DUF4417 domain-containing protein n=1 Tax=Eubacterium uniforme TaxID=39495 RepID=A0A1T4VW94_9FIRM|nr:DUF4417 domain-containing protein [Eubacterium uniforme]SKA69169.1 protein of unknown function [Eubacterium uniforme]